MILLPVVIGVVRNSEGHFLLGKRHQPEIPEINGKWNLLGGKVDFGERPEEAIVREIREESGLEVTVVRLLPIIATRYRTRTDGTKLQIVGICFECSAANSTLPEKDADEGVVELTFVPHHQLDSYDLVEGERDIINLVL